MDINNLTYKTYTSEMLPAILTVWNKGEFGQKFPLTPELWKQQVERDPSFLPQDFLGAFDPADDLVGFVLSRQFRDLPEHPDMESYANQGWIGAILVEESERGKGIGSKLLKKAEALMPPDSLHKISVGGNYGHFFPGIPVNLPSALDFFQKHGYNLEKERGDAYDLRRPLTNYTGLALVPAVAHNEFYFTQATLEDKDALLGFLHKHFPGRWRYSMYNYFEQGGFAGDITLLKNTSTQQIAGFLQTGHKNSPIIANSLFWHKLLEDNYGGIGPLGIAPEVRGKDLGLALVDAGVNYLLTQGVTDCAIDWTSLSLLDFYGKLGFEVWKIFKRYSKLQ